MHSQDLRLALERFLSRGTTRWLGTWVADLTIRSMISSAASSVTLGDSSVPMFHELVDPERLDSQRMPCAYREEKQKKQNVVFVELTSIRGGFPQGPVIAELVTCTGCWPVPTCACYPASAVETWIGIFILYFLTTQLCSCLLLISLSLSLVSAINTCRSYDHLGANDLSQMLHSTTVAASKVHPRQGESLRYCWISSPSVAVCT